MPPELGGILYLDFREGVHGIVVHLLPGDGENGLVQIIANQAVVVDLLIQLEISLLTVQHPLCLLQHRFHVRRAADGAVEGLVGFRGCRRVGGNGVVLVGRLGFRLGGQGKV